MTPIASVRQTDCKTGWQVVSAGRLIASYRRREPAVSHAAVLNARPDYNPKVDWPERYSDGRPI
jgi:hypothetical protein